MFSESQQWQLRFESPREIEPEIVSAQSPFLFSLDTQRTIAARVKVGVIEHWSFWTRQSIDNECSLAN